MSWTLYQPHWLKECIDNFVPYITIIVNKSFAEGIFPNTKDCIHKTSVKEDWIADKEGFKNYRPVANLGF